MGRRIEVERGAMPKRVLIIDNEEDIRELIVQVLESADYEVLRAAGGEQGLEILATIPVDLVLLDIMMEGMDGWRVCECIKADARLNHIPVLFVTVRSLLSEQEENRNRLADGVLRKPFSLRELQQAVASLTGADREA